MNITQERSIKAKILHKLMRMNKWEHSHTAIENLRKSFPKHVRGAVDKTVEELIREGFLHVKPTSYGKHVSLNIRRKEEIEKIVSSLARG
jgi:uncharacterized protein YajQ (UPF0234 family)